MAGLMGSLSIALSGLQAAQEGVNVASNDISNANTPGYARQQVDLSEQTPVAIGDTLLGTGVAVDKVESLRDNVLELRIADETGQQAQSGAYLTGMNQVQAMFNDAQGTGLQSVISNFFDSFSQLSTDPTNSPLRQGVLTAAQNLASTLNETATNLTQIQGSLDQQVSADVSNVNNITSQIAQLNGQISQAPQGANAAGMLIDQRTYLVQQLSGIVGVSVSNTNNGEISVSTANGVALVAGQQNFALTAQTNSTTGHQDVYAQGSDITSMLSGGDLAGAIQARDGQGIGGILSQLDTLASGIATAVNNQQAQGADLNGKTGSPIFSTPSGSGYAGTMKVIMTDPSAIAAASQTGGTGDNTNALALADLQNQAVVATETPINYYSNFVSGLGNDISGTTAENSSQQLVLQQLQQQRSSVSGVSMDEEAVNLIQFQRAYQASAQVISIVESLSNTAIQMTSGG
jgi:flagellar hook-associated protein 1 FlgK